MCSTWMDVCGGLDGKRDGGRGSLEMCRMAVALSL